VLLAAVAIVIATSIDDPSPAICAVLPKGTTKYAMCRDGTRGTFVKITLSKENQIFSGCDIHVSAYPGKLTFRSRISHRSGSMPRPLNSRLRDLGSKLVLPCQTLA